MNTDSIIDEVRAARERLAARFDFDIHRIMEDARQRQSQYGARLISFEHESRAKEALAEAPRVSPTAP